MTYYNYLQNKNLESVISIVFAIGHKLSSQFTLDDINFKYTSEEEINYLLRMIEIETNFRIADMSDSIKTKLMEELNELSSIKVRNKCPR